MGPELIVDLPHEEMVLKLAEIPTVAMIKRKQDCKASPEDTQTKTSRAAEHIVKYWSKLKKRGRRHDFHPLGDVLGGDSR